MTQTRRDPDFKLELGQRLKLLVSMHLGVSWADLAAQLGYRNSSALRQARDGNALISAEKLAILAKLEFGSERAHVSLDWLLTGSGQPLRHATTATISEFAPTSLMTRVDRASPTVQAKISAFLEVAEINSDLL